MKRAVALAFAIAGCAPRPAAPSTAAPCDDSFGAPATFALDRRALAAKGASPALLEKLDRSAYSYFRALSKQYELRTCAAFRDVRWHLPVVAIHADAHIEQFVVTPTTAGLEDFDQSAYGPAVVDVVRYASSIHLACGEVKWPCDADALVAAYFDAYRASLDRPPVRVAPSVVARLRASTPAAQEPWLKWADGLAQPLAPEREAKARKGWVDFVHLQREIHPERPATFYDVVHVGQLQMGVGSALETKLLFRIRGPSEAPSDDLVVEARTTTPPTGKECASRPGHGGALQPLMFMALLGPRMPEIAGFATLVDETAPEFWVQSWVPGYRELAVSDVANASEMNELVVDAARQLAGYFWEKFPEELRAMQRHAQLKAFDATRDRARVLARELAGETRHDWEKFRAAR